MNKILLLFLLLLISCGGKVEPVKVQCNYTAYLEQNNNLIAQNSACQTEKNKCNTDIIDLKNTNNVLKIQILNQNQTDCVQTSCNTVVRLLNDKEDQLELCWLNSNATTHITNVSTFNQTLYNLWDNCSDTLEAINNSLN